MSTRRRSILIATLLATLAVAPAAQAAQQEITSTGPLYEIVLGDQTNCQVYHTADGTTGEFYPTTDVGACGTFLLVDGTRYTPANVPAGASAVGTPWTVVSQSAVMGSGTLADPYRVVTVVHAGATGVRVEQTDSYIAGEEAYQTDVKVINNGTQPQSVRLWRAADCFLGGSDSGFGRVTGDAVACTDTNQPDSRIEEWRPLTPGSSYYQANYSEVWSLIGGNSAFPNTCECAIEQDNGAGLSWDFTVPAGGSGTQSHLTNFSPTGKEPITIEKSADSSTSSPGAQNGYTIAIHNTNDVVLEGDFTDTLPASFSYVPGSTTGAGEPTVSGQDLTFENVTLPANGDATITFDVIVSSTPGTYVNEVDGTVATYTVVGTGPTAPITVEQQQSDTEGRMVGNGTLGSTRYASIIDCPAEVANAKDRPFTVEFRHNGVPKRFTLDEVTSVSCDDASGGQASPPYGFDRQTGEGTGMVGSQPATIEWVLVDGGGGNSGDSTRLLIRQGSTTVLDQGPARPGGGGNYALPPTPAQST